MAAYAALLSLARSLHQILNLEQYIDPLHKEKVVSLHEKVDEIVIFLEDYSEKHPGTLHLIENGIRKAAYEAQDFIDSYPSAESRTYADSSSSKAGDEVSVGQDLNMALKRINFIQEEMMKMKMKMKNNNPVKDLPSGTYTSPVNHSSTVKITARNMLVGLDDDLNAIKERLYDDSAKLQVIPIVGMGGIGKTTLARKAYEDSVLTQYFDIGAWVMVSQQYQRREILSGLLQSFKNPYNEESDKSEAQLATLVYQNLKGRRYLVVIDDLWSAKAWDDLKMIFPDDGNGSRILLTTRLSDVAVHASSAPLHQMNLLNEDQSWKLLQERIFIQESCPLQLVEIGKKIARNCRGLPLTIVVVAGLLLSSGNMKKELWENISENISSTEPTMAQYCSKILYLSYDWLPPQLKPCFLYIAAFPEDSEIDVSKLIMLWIAEGFLRPSDHSKCLEDVGERYLKDLVNRSLIFASKEEPDGKLKTIGIHDLLREICITKAEEEMFLHHFSPKRNAQKGDIANPIRRLSIRCTHTFQELRIQDSSLRSVLFFTERNYGSRLYLSCRGLNVLDASKVTWPNFPDIISTFVNLRYIAFAFNVISCPHGFPTSLCKLPNLQTIIVHKTDLGDFKIPYEIWEMPNLRHFIMDTPFRLPIPSNIEILHGVDIQTLHTVIDFRFTEEVVKILVNLKKLKLLFTKSCDTGDFYFHNLFRLQNLEELHVLFYLPNPSAIWNHAFPTSLKKLTLRCVPLPWENMDIIGSLPNLQVLEMMFIDVDQVSEWTPMEGQFLRLKYFYSSLDYLVKWDVEKEHFASLESLILWRAQWIDEIPRGIGEIDSLQLIELQHCRKSLVNSAKRIEEQQLENGNEAFQVRLIDCDE